MEDKMYSYKYPHPSVTTDCVIFGFDGTKLQVLLVERGIEHLKKLAEKWFEQYYTIGKHFPASMILRLYGIHA
jgi:hypothetical protein